MMLKLIDKIYYLYWIGAIPGRTSYETYLFWDFKQVLVRYKLRFTKVVLAQRFNKLWTDSAQQFQRIRAVFSKWKLPGCQNFINTGLKENGCGSRVLLSEDYLCKSRNEWFLLMLTAKLRFPWLINLNTLLQGRRPTPFHKWLSFSDRRALVSPVLSRHTILCTSRSSSYTNIRI